MLKGSLSGQDRYTGALSGQVHRQARVFPFLRAIVGWAIIGRDTIGGDEPPAGTVTANTRITGNIIGLSRISGRLE